MVYSALFGFVCVRKKKREKGRRRCVNLAPNRVFRDFDRYVCTRSLT
jgi:hypothetical protein